MVALLVVQEVSIGLSLQARLVLEIVLILSLIHISIKVSHALIDVGILVTLLRCIEIGFLVSRRLLFGLFDFLNIFSFPFGETPVSACL